MKAGLGQQFYFTYRYKDDKLSLNNLKFFFVFYSPFSIAITSLREDRAHLSFFRTFARFVLVWFCLFPLLLGVWEGLWFVIVALPRLSSYLFQNTLN